MSRNGRLAHAYHILFVIFTLAPILAVVAVSFTPEGYLSLPTSRLSLRWFDAIADHPEFIAAFTTSLFLGAVSSLVGSGWQWENPFSFSWVWASSAALDADWVTSRL